MIRVSVAIAAAVLLVIAPWGLGRHATAQQQPIGAPIKLVPRKPVAPAPAQPPAPAAPTGIVVEGLADIDGEAIGLLGPSQGGLGTAMWAGTGRGLVERLLPLLPATPPFSTARDLTRRLLLTAATPPAGPALTTSLLTLRAQRLIAIGDIAAASALVDASPDRQVNADLARISLERRLLDDDLAGACSLAALVVETSVYWQQAQIFCRAIARDADFAILGLDLLREQGVDDPAFFALIAKLNGDAGGIPESGAATPLAFALFMATQTPIPGWFVEAAGPAVLAAVAAAPTVDLALRLRAGERAERAGALPTSQLAELYRGINLNPEQVAGAVTTPADYPAITPLAASYLAAREYSVPAARAEALRSAWVQARAQGNYPAMARLSVDLLAEIAPATSLAWFAGDAIRALLLTGGGDRALAWYRLARTEAAFDPDAAQSEVLAWPLLRLAFGDGQGALLAWDDSRVDAWLANLRQNDPASAGRAALLLALLDAQGDPIGASRWTDLIGGGPGAILPEPALWFALSEAAAAGRLGETVLLALVILGEAEAPRQQGLVLPLVVTSLQQVGLAAAARSLAVEAAVMAGL